MTQFKPKKCNRPLPDGIDEAELDKQLREASDRLFAGMVDANGYIKITPSSLKEIFNRAKKQTDGAS
jgi:hypothetical protein